MIDIHEVITSPCALANRYIVRDGFVFTSITHPANVFDTIVMKDPSDAPCCSSGIIASSYSLQEQIDFIAQTKLNHHQMEVLEQAFEDGLDIKDVQHHIHPDITVSELSTICSNLLEQMAENMEQDMGGIE